MFVLQTEMQIIIHPCKVHTNKFGLPDESKDLQVPSGFSIPNFMNCTDVFGLSSRLTPPTRAASQWPWRMAWKAFSRASRLEEHAVSMEVLGPGGTGKGYRSGRGQQKRLNKPFHVSPTCWTIVYPLHPKAEDFCWSFTHGWSLHCPLLSTFHILPFLFITKQICFPIQLWTKTLW